jgi:UTP--glucose-1-phosphate uridylyltransferase
MKVRKAVIPAAGLGTRMLPATKTIPKEMLPMVDKPVIQYIIEEAVASGIEDILIVTNRAKSAMDDYFDYHPELEERLLKNGKTKEAESVRMSADLANIFYVRQKETKGLGHAIWRAKRFVGDEPFAVLLGDDIMMAQTPVTKQLIDEAEKYHACAVGVQTVLDENISKYSSVKVSPLDSRVYRVSDMNEKPTIAEKFSNYAILGRYVLTSEIFDILENTPPGYGGEIQLTDGLKQLCKQSPMVAVDFEGRRYDTGNLKGFLEATIDYALTSEEIGPWLRAFIAEKAASLTHEINSVPRTVKKAADF